MSGLPRRYAPRNDGDGGRLENNYLNVKLRIGIVRNKVKEEFGQPCCPINTTYRLELKKLELPGGVLALTNDVN